MFYLRWILVSFLEFFALKTGVNILHFQRFIAVFSTVGIKVLVFTVKNPLMFDFYFQLN